MKIAIGNDHAAVELKMQIKEFIESMGHEVVNYGVDTAESCNYPEIGEKVGRAVADGEVDCAVLICGTGVGISIAANKVNGVRAAVCSDVTTASGKRAQRCKYHRVWCKNCRSGAGKGYCEGLSECGISWWTSCDTRGYACGHRKTEQIKYLKSIPFYSKIVSRETLYS